MGICMGTFAICANIENLIKEREKLKEEIKLIKNMNKVRLSSINEEKLFPYYMKDIHIADCTNSVIFIFGSTYGSLLPENDIVIENIDLYEHITIFLLKIIKKKLLSKKIRIIGEQIFKNVYIEEEFSSVLLSEKISSLINQHCPKKEQTPTSEDISYTILNTTLLPNTIYQNDNFS